ncbi:hypothetical protein BpHYR1_023058 [Brachionus plicatilis]|uniref:Uncharacterized protein n=1 Tax=Brachionus plicatilis TaxID=10195 RepID=A0A3M7SLF3_BRAPC|nr:hypothetical protein BpHYR1_023058 [Brachionus plicatilis]
MSQESIQKEITKESITKDKSDFKKQRFFLISYGSLIFHACTLFVTRTPLVSINHFLPIAFVITDIQETVKIIAMTYFILLLLIKSDHNLANTGNNLNFINS